MLPTSRVPTHWRKLRPSGPSAHVQSGSSPGAPSNAQCPEIQLSAAILHAERTESNGSRRIFRIAPLARPLEPWRVAEDWSKDKTSISLLTGKPGEPDRIALNLTRGREGKNAIGRRVEGDLRGYRWVVVDLDNRITAGTRVARREPLMVTPCPCGGAHGASR